MDGQAEVIQTAVVLSVAALIGWMLNGPLGLALGIGYLVWLVRQRQEAG